LNDFHYNVIALKEAIPYLEKKKKIPPKTIVLTFDDGFYNNYTYAYPLLRKYNMPATIFIVTGWLETPGYLGWGEVKEMSDSGIITIGSHTINHFELIKLNSDDLEREIKESKSILENRLGKRVDLFCYPKGEFNKKVHDAVKDAGYICAAGTNPGRAGYSNDIFAIKRVKISRTSDNLILFWAETTRLYSWIKEKTSLWHKNAY
jgi:peptidoglycan/xylan/chitin deacetylase (PgdA/CDA1 family)